MGAAAVTCTWEPDACTAAAGTATLATIDPPALSATIVEIMMFRPMRMTPPWLLPRSAARCMAPAARTAHLNNVGLLPICGNSAQLRYFVVYRFHQILMIAMKIIPGWGWITSLEDVLKDSLQSALHSARAAWINTSRRNTVSHAELASE